MFHPIFHGEIRMKSPFFPDQILFFSPCRLPEKVCQEPSQLVAGLTGAALAYWAWNRWGYSGFSGINIYKFVLYKMYIYI